MQCARYKQGDFIDPHDDKAFAAVNGAIHSRDVAIILHLTPNWSIDDGGAFVDHAAGVARAPLFNSMVAFRVPRQHEVSRVISASPRFSIYGWFMSPGRLYDLDVGSNKRRRKGKRARAASE
eukprot:UN1893